MFVETKRLLLRKLQQEDCADFCEFAVDPERNRMMGNSGISNVDDARGMFEWLMENEPRIYAIVLKESGKVIGDFTVYNKVSDDLTALPELAGKTGRSLSFSISRAYQRQGLISEAVRAVAAHLFQVEGVDYINSGSFDFNIPSRELHKKLGFSYLTTHRCFADGEEYTGIEHILWRETVQ